MLIKKEYTVLEVILSYLFIFMSARAAECYNIYPYEMLVIVPVIMMSTYVILTEVILFIEFVIKKVKK